MFGMITSMDTATKLLDLLSTYPRLEDIPITSWQPWCNTTH